MKEQEVTIQIRASLIGDGEGARAELVAAIRLALLKMEREHAPVLDGNGNRVGVISITTEGV